MGWKRHIRFLLAESRERAENELIAFGRDCEENR